MTFAGGCDVGDRVKLAAVGDLIFHTRLLRDAFARQSGFVPFWRPVESVLASADVTYGNLEGPAADGLAAGGRKVRDPGMRVDYRVYGYRLPNLSFNFHPSVIGQLKSTGFDILSTSNNHSLDRGAAGVDRTIKNFEAAGLAHVGTRKLGGEAQRWSTVTERSGAKLAWLACTFSTNGIPDRAGQTLNCYRDTDQVLGEIAAMAKREDIAGVILAPHWGSENVHRPDGSQRRRGTLVLFQMLAAAAFVLLTLPQAIGPVWIGALLAAGGFFAGSSVLYYALGNDRAPPHHAGLFLALIHAGFVTGAAGSVHRRRWPHRARRARD